MSNKDIRSFFTVIPNQKVKASHTHGPVKTRGQRKRTKVIDSDSEDDSKRSKSATVEGTHTKNKQEDQTVSSKYFSVKAVNAGDIFKARPVKRDNSRNIIKKSVTKEEKEFHFDKDFESELLQLDAVDLNPLTKDVTDSYNNQESKLKPIEKLSKDFTSIKAENNNSGPKCEKKNHHKKTAGESDYYESPRKKIKTESVLNSSVIKDKAPTLNETKQAYVKSTKECSEKKSSPKLYPSINKMTTNIINPMSMSITKISPLQKSPTKMLIVCSPPSSPRRSSDLKLCHKEQNKTKRVLEICSSNNKFPSAKTDRKKKQSSVNQISPSKGDSIILRDSPSKHNNNKKQVKDKTNPNVRDETVTLPQTASSLWVEKYKPTTTKQIIGQQGEKSCVNKLTTWLKNWHRNHSGNKTLVKPSPWAKNDDGGYFKAALLSGPPGVGKTTTAHLVSRELEFDVVEFNASDTRSKKLLHLEVSELLSTNSLSPFFTGKGNQVTKKHVLLMDEVDGMAGNEDRGGVQELIQLIRQSRVPIICMCNDRNHPKIRSLANYCFDLRFSKPRAEQVRGAMLSLCFKEKLKLSTNSLTDIITSANQDIRLIINHLSMLSMESSNLANSTKHIKMGPWDITRKVFSEEEHKSMSISDKCDLFFHDYSVTPLFVQENYLNAVPHKPEAKNKIKKIELFAAAAKSLSLGDLTEKRIRTSNAWSLLPVQAVFSSLVPGQILEGHLGGQINFPAWFGKNSRQSKASRLLQELTVHARLKISGNKEAMNLDYLSPLKESIVSPLVELGTDGIPQALSVLSEYCLVREDLESLSELSSWSHTKDQFSDVDSKVKAAFTRAYNKTSTPTPYAAVPIKKGSKTGIENSDAILDEEGNLTQEPEDEEDDGLEVDAMIVVKKKPSAKRTMKEDLPCTSKGSKNTKLRRKK